MSFLNIAVDGPSGAGKSTVSKAVAKALGIIYLDTGAMYRALGLKSLRKGIDPNDEAGVLGFLHQTEVEIRYENGQQQVYLDGENVESYIREHSVSKAASDISKIRAVRIKMVDLQRQIAARNNVIMDGRDIGTFVLPNAKYKFYLDAKPEIRAKRRFLELQAKGQQKSYEEILADVVSRDQNDAGRDFAPLKRAEDAVLIDSSEMSESEVINFIVKSVK